MQSILKGTYFYAWYGPICSCTSPLGVAVFFGSKIKSVLYFVYSNAFSLPREVSFCQSCFFFQSLFRLHYRRGRRRHMSSPTKVCGSVFNLRNTATLCAHMSPSSSHPSSLCVDFLFLLCGGSICDLVTSSCRNQTSRLKPFALF